MKGGIQGEPRPRRGRGTGAVSAGRMDAELDRAERKAERNRRANRRDVDTPDVHDLDHELNWPAWRMEVEALAERMTGAGVAILKR